MPSQAPVIAVRVSAEEKAEVEAAARADQRSVSQWCRLVLLERARRQTGAGQVAASPEPADENTC